MAVVIGILATGILATGILAVSYVCYRMGFYAPPRKPVGEEVMEFPEGEVYEPFHEKMAHWIRQTRALPQEDVWIRSFDGLRLHGKYFELSPDAPMELMFHGYRGSAERDLPGGVQRCFACGRSALIVDQRCSGKSEGNTITFGVNEHKDCLAWVNYACGRFGPERKIILTGISMGAATVIMAAGKPLPPNVIGVIADCGYSTQGQIIRKVVREMGLPPKLSYPFVKLGAKIFGKFDLEEFSPMQALETCTVPIAFFHGEADGFVPCAMSEKLYHAYGGKKCLLTVPGADHGLSYAVEPKRYREVLVDFFGADASAPEPRIL